MKGQIGDRHRERYEIWIEGHLDPRWSEFFDGLEITHPTDRETLLSGAVADQSALHGLLGRLRDMNLKLVSVQRQ